MKLHALKNNPNSIIEFGPSTIEEGVWYLKEYSSKEHQAFIDYPIFIANYLIVINFITKKDKQKISLLLAKDSLAPDDFRKLKFILKTLNCGISDQVQRKHAI